MDLPEFNTGLVAELEKEIARQCARCELAIGKPMTKEQTESITQLVLSGAMVMKLYFRKHMNMTLKVVN